MACEIKLLESEATTGYFVLLGEQGNKAVLDWVMKGLIPSRYESPKCKKDMSLVERKGTIDGFEWRYRVQSKENPHFVCRSTVNPSLCKSSCQCRLEILPLPKLYADLPKGVIFSLMYAEQLCELAGWGVLQFVQLTELVQYPTWHAPQ
ncbi:hypothetical protein TNCV_70301 [Trichonephila clavipes]|nr:hypothetical protein TNCV_70301 [Trichonephila clavipes]